MNQIQKSIMIIGSLVVSFLIVNFVTSSNYAFAIEYKTYTTRAFGIEFQYPSEWMVSEGGNLYIVVSNPNDGSISLDIAKNPIHEQVHDLQTFTDELFRFINELYSSDSDKIIQNPTPISTGNLEMQAFLITQQSNEAVQHWTFTGNGHEYVIQFFSPVSKFNSPENVEILDHFIKSIKIVSADK